MHQERDITVNELWGGGEVSLEVGLIGGDGSEDVTLDRFETTLSRWIHGKRMKIIFSGKLCFGVCLFGGKENKWKWYTFLFQEVMNNYWRRWSWRVGTGIKTEWWHGRKVDKDEVHFLVGFFVGKYQISPLGKY